MKDKYRLIGESPNSLYLTRHEMEELDRDFNLKVYSKNAYALVVLTKNEFDRAFSNVTEHNQKGGVKA